MGAGIKQDAEIVDGSLNGLNLKNSHGYLSVQQEYDVRTGFFPDL